MWDKGGDKEHIALTNRIYSTDKTNNVYRPTSLKIIRLGRRRLLDGTYVYICANRMYMTNRLGKISKLKLAATVISIETLAGRPLIASQSKPIKRIKFQKVTESVLLRINWLISRLSAGEWS